MKHKLTILGILILGTIVLASTGLLEPDDVLASCDASSVACEDNRETERDGGGSAGTCTIDSASCQTTCTGPLGVECCCFYRCPSGNTWVCKQGVYCSNSHGGCL